MDKKKRIFLIWLVLTIVILSSDFHTINVKADDNYSTYLYNTSINVDNDKAHLFQEISDGSNSYRNLFQSNFLFPAKLQNDMLSSFPTSNFNRYSFNQFYFDHLNNDYAYGSSTNFNQENKTLDNFNINNGSLYRDGSTEFINDFNATYNFDYNYGNYSGTYSFNNEVGLTNTEISFIDSYSSGTYTEVISNINNHDNVLYYTNTETWKAQVNRFYEVYGSQTSGIIEFWIMFSETNKRHIINFAQDWSNYIGIHYHNDGNIYYYDGNFHYLESYNAYQWYHTKIVFNVSNVWNLYIDGIKKDVSGFNFFGNPDYLSNIFIQSGAETNIHTYLDGIGFSFDDNYEIGDNIKPYSFYGYYEATYSFDDYSELDDFETYTYNGDQSYYSIDDINNHKSCFTLYDVSNSEYIYSFVDFDYQTANTIEFYALTNETTRGLLQLLDNNGITIISLRFHSNGYIQAYDSGVMNDVIPYSINTWYHFKIEFDNTLSNYDLYINGVLECENYDYVDSCTYLSRFRFITYTSTYSLLSIDALGFCWLDYEIGDNINPYGVQEELYNDNFECEVDFNSSLCISDIGNFHRNVVNFTVNTNEDSFWYNFTDYKTIESIEFQIYMIDVSKDIEIKLWYIGVSGLPAIYFRNYDSKFQYFESGWQDLINTENNKWYSFYVKFDCNSHLYNLSIDRIDYLTNKPFKNNLNSLNFLQFEIFEQPNTILLDNFDFSWIEGYYPYRILTPNSDLFESEYKKSVYLGDIYPNDDITNEWNYADTSNYYESIDDWSTSDCIQTWWYSYDEEEEQIEYFDLETLTLPNGYYVSQANVLLLYAYLGSPTFMSTDAKVRLNYGVYTDYQIIPFYSETTENTEIQFNLNLSQSQLNNLKIEFLSPSYITSASHFIIYGCYIEIYYDVLGVDVSYEKEFTYGYEKPTIFTLYYHVLTDINCNVDLYMWNYDLEMYFLMNSNNYFNDFNEYSYVLNESAYFRFEKLRIAINSSIGSNSLLIVDYLVLNIKYYVQEENGYQEIICYNYRYDDSSELGYFKFELRIFNESIQYRYSEINYYTNDYIYAWQIYNTSNIELENLELQIHCRYGLNTLDVEILNFYAIIYLNYDKNNVIEFREQSRKELTSHRLKSSFNYTSCTSNYLNTTGIIGNYSYSCLKGMRSLYGSTDETFHRYFTIPYFNDEISVAVLPIDNQMEDVSGLEPEYPSLPYWTYTSYRLTNYQTVSIDIGNWSVEYKTIQAEKYEARYPYNPKSYDEDDWGSWKWKIKFTDSFSYTVNFNFMRNAWNDMVNILMVFFQYIEYLGKSFSGVVFMYLYTSMVSFLWNFVVYYLFYALIFILWYLFEGLVYVLEAIWLGLVWVYENLLLPFLEWFFYDFFPLAVEVFIIVWAHIITILIYCMTLGQIDYDETYNTVYDILRTTADFLLENGVIVLENLPALFIAIALYLLLILYTYFKYIYCKIRGYKERAEALYDSLMTYLLPITWTYQIIKKIYDALPVA